MDAHQPELTTPATYDTRLEPADSLWLTDNLHTRLAECAYFSAVTRGCEPQCTSTYPPFGEQHHLPQNRSERDTAGDGACARGGRHPRHQITGDDDATSWTMQASGLRVVRVVMRSIRPLSG